MTRLDWIIVGFVGISALAGLRRGLIRTVLTIAGLAAGAMVGGRIAGWHGAVAGAVAGQLAAMIVGRIVRLLPPLRILDSLGGLAAGAAWGLVLAWVAAAVVAQLPGHPSWHHDVEQSHVIRRLNAYAPPRDLLRLWSHRGQVGFTSIGTSTR